jgi:hypothetical protein
MGYAPNAQHNKNSQLHGCLGAVMANENLAMTACPHCGGQAPVRKVKNSPLLYLACSCGTHKSSSAAFQEKLQKAVSGISESESENNPANSENLGTEWSPTIKTQSAPLLGASENQQNQPEPQNTATKGGILKKVAGFSLLLLAVGGLVLKVAK